MNQAGCEPRLLPRNALYCTDINNIILQTNSEQMENKSMTNEEFFAKKREALVNEPVYKRADLSQIRLSDDSLRNNTVEVDGKTLRVSSGFFGALAKRLNVPEKLKSDVAGRDKNDPNGSFARLANALVNNKGGRVTLIGDPSTSVIHSVANDNYGRVPNSVMFDVIERIADKYPNVRPVGIDVRGGGMRVDARLLTSNDVLLGGDPRGGGGGVRMDDEVFNFGIELSNGYSTSIGDFMYRLMCENGMMGTQKKTNFSLSSMSKNGMLDMLEHIAQLERAGFVPPELYAQVQAAMRCNASYAEARELYEKTKSLISAGEADLRAHYEAALKRDFFRGVKQAEEKLAKAGIKNLPAADAKFVNSGQPMWELINNVTWLGSHNTAYEMRDSGLLMKLGGKALAKTPDLGRVELLLL